MLSMCAVCTCTIRSQAELNGDLHVLQCSHLLLLPLLLLLLLLLLPPDDDDDEQEEEEV